eukprot:TRINITY_DN5734_c0_g1_i3.p1 TRINITY_DN5734_c0_g1~~TRINITY_DN5734_c0_g1_i3.p1  ORF type:complete len:633 (-),score=128.00 TRINITY_DN5734_c0_g1_i3:1280-3178(-)
MVGDYNNPPTIKFVSTTDEDQRVIDAAGLWYPDVNQNNFYHEIRNFVIDMLECNSCTGTHWQVAQATQISNVVYKMSPESQGIWMENGSGGFISDLVFEGGKFGLWIGNQQFTSRNITIRGASSAGVYLNWDWGWTFQGLNIEDSPIGVDVGDGAGTLILLDSRLYHCDIGVRTVFTTEHATNSMILENVEIVTKSSDSIAVMNNNVPTLKPPVGKTIIEGWAQGHIWEKGDNQIQAFNTSNFVPQRPKVLTSDGNKFFTKMRPHFDDLVDVTTFGVVGDGKTDNTEKLQAALEQSAGKNSLFFPYGTYLIMDTVYIPPGSKLLGEVWSVLMAAGTNFNATTSPKPMLQVGDHGETGVAQLVDLLITTRGPQPSAKLIEWNMHESYPGACGMWDVHFRIGGAAGSNINPSNCPRGDGSNAPESVCTGAWAMMHITETGSCYMENIWGWTADHDLDDETQINVYNTRGFLSESKGPIWMYGTAMEHNILYQYNFVNSENVVMGLIQTETPYFQPSVNTPFNATDPTDPIFCDINKNPKCAMSYAVNIDKSQDIFTYGAGLYSFFDCWSQDCLQDTPPSCQRELVKIRRSKHIYTYGLNTYGSFYMLTADEKYSKAGSNQNVFCSTVAVDFNNF